MPVHKKSEKNLKGNYRPISLLPVFGKILEKLIYDSLYSHLASYDLLNHVNQCGQPDDKLQGIQNMISGGSRLIEEAKRGYFLKAGRALANPEIGTKKYWSLINTVLNKAKIPIILPLLEDGIFITNFAEKAQIFNDYFIQQCTTIDTGSQLPQHIPATITQLNDFVISEEKILNIIRSLNPNKTNGWDGISVRMIKLNQAMIK